MYQPMGEGRARARKMIERAGYKLGGEMAESKSDTEADIARVKKAFGQHDNQLHGGKRTRLHFADGGMAGDRLDQRPRGRGKAAPAGKHGTQVNVAVMPNKDPGAAAPPPAAAAPPHPPMMPPHPPMGGPPPGGAMPPPGAGMPPPGMGGPPPGLPPGGGMPPPRPPMMPPPPGGGMPPRPPGMQSGGRARRLDGGMAAPQGALGMGGAPPMAPPGLAGGMPPQAMGGPPTGMPAGGMPPGMPPGAMGRPPGMKRGGRSMGGNMSSPEEMPRPKAHFRRGGKMDAGAISGEGRLEKIEQLNDLGD